MAVIFNGREFASKIEGELGNRFSKLAQKPTLVTIYNTNDEASRIYSNIKAKKATELGVNFKQYGLVSTTDLEGLISNVNKQPGVDGLMIQLPLTDDKSRDIKLAWLIDPAKDADGLNPRSGVVPATVRAVLAILEEALKLPIFDYQFTSNPAVGVSQVFNVCVVGIGGVVGRPLAQKLEKDERFSVSGMGRYNFSTEKLKEADIVISATGQQGLIKPEMIKQDAICIDVGYPHGDFEPEVASKVAFFTPVPGGVGPVTVAMLFANLLDIASRRQSR